MKHQDGNRLAIFEVVIFKIPTSVHYPDGIKYSAWFSEGGKTVFGFDNHKPKGPHLHIDEKEVGYVYRGIKELRADAEAMIEKAGFIYEK
ncbi:MAG: DUF6516 family protein [Bdellovibrionales bacterium]